MLLWGSTLSGLRTVAQEGVNTVNRLDLYAAFLTKFPHFIQWTADGERQGKAQIRLGVIGEDSFSDEAIRSIESQTFNGFPIKFVKLASISAIDEIDMLFIHASERERVEEITNAAKGKGTLTFAAIPRFCQRGGMINFVTIKGKTRFEINLKRVTAERIKISTKVLRMARIRE